MLDCLGWFTRDLGRARHLVGFACKLPTWADKSRPPVSLFTLIKNAKEDGGSSTPSLRTRFCLARALAQAVYHLQCSQWLHRTLGSHQIIFFYDAESADLRLDAPFLSGLQHSRPDDQLVDGKDGDRDISKGKAEVKGPMTSIVSESRCSRSQTGR